MKTLTISLFFMLIFLGCGSDYGSDAKKDGTVETTVPTTLVDTGVPVNETLAFSDVHTALKTKCLACHGNSGGFSLGSVATPLNQAEAYNNILLFVGGTSSADNTILLQKSTGALSHGGSKVLEKTSYEYKITSAWIEAGSTLDMSFDVNTTTTGTTANPGYDEPQAQALTFTRNHHDGVTSVQGQACIACHNRGGEGDIVRFGGTLSSYIHTPDKQYYQDLSAYSVNLVGNKGSDFSASVQSAASTTGHNNFYKSTSYHFVEGESFTVYIKDANNNTLNQSGTNTHNSSTHTDCNNCHTKDGKNNAPGRVLVPLVN